MLPIVLLSLAVVSLLAVSVLERMVERREAMGLFWAEADLEALVKSGAAFVFALPYCLPAELPPSEPIVFASVSSSGGSAAGGNEALAASVDPFREGRFEAMLAPGEGWAVAFPATGLAGETVCVSWRLEASDGEAVAVRLLAAVAPDGAPPPEDGAAWRVLWEGASAGQEEGCSAEAAVSALWTIEDGGGDFRRRGWLRWVMVSFSGAEMEEGRPFSGAANEKGPPFSGETNEEGSLFSGGSENEGRQVRFSELKLRLLDPCHRQREALKALEEIAPRAGRWDDRAGRPADGPVGTIRVAAFAGPDPAADAPADAAAVSVPPAAADVRSDAASGIWETPRFPAWAVGTLEVAMPAPDLLTAPLPAEYDRIERRYTFLRSFSDGPGGLRDRLACWARTNWSGYDPKRHACRSPE